MDDCNPQLPGSIDIRNAYLLTVDFDVSLIRLVNSAHHFDNC